MVASGVVKAVIETIAAVDNLITQGFQQPHLTITTVEENPDLDFTITAYPNPAHGIVNLKVDSDDLICHKHPATKHKKRAGEREFNPNKRSSWKVTDIH